MTLSKLIGAVLCYAVLTVAVKDSTISSDAGLIAISIMLAGFMAGGKDD